MQLDGVGSDNSEDLDVDGVDETGGFVDHSRLGTGDDSTLAGVLTSQLTERGIRRRARNWGLERAWDFRYHLLTSNLDDNTCVTLTWDAIIEDDYRVLEWREGMPTEPTLRIF